MLDIPLKTEEILSALAPASASALLPESVKYICTRSSLCEAGDLFIALRGERFSGDDFIPEAKARGAITVGVSDKADIRVSEKAFPLLALATLYKSKLTRLIHTVIITGSVGKTTTKELLYHTLCVRYKCHFTEGNLNNTVGAPLTVLKAPSDTEVLIIEAGMNMKNEIYKISVALSPSIAIITNIGTSHIGNLASRENIASAKLEVLAGMTRPFVIVPKDEPLLFGADGRLTVSLTDTNADYSLIKNEDYLHFFKRGHPVGNIKDTSRGAHIQGCLVFALAVCDILSVPFSHLNDAVRQALPSLSRQKFICISGITLIDDTYNASCEAVISALDTLCNVKASRRIALLSDMLELGSHAGALHERCGGECARKNIDFLLTYGKFAHIYALGARNFGMSEEKIINLSDANSTDALSTRVCDIVRAGDALLIKGSHATGLYELIPKLKERLKVKKQ